MKLFLQMGHGMQALAEEMIRLWGAGNVILSPVNIKEDKIESYSKRIIANGGEVLFDPQMFYPKEGHDKLKLYDYWPLAGVSIASDEVQKHINRGLLRINSRLNTSYIILPGLEMKDTDLNYGLSWLNQSAQYFKDKTDKPLLGTLCLYPEVIRNSEIVESLVEYLKIVPVDGFYIIPHPANNEYIVSDAMWVIGMMKLVTCLKILHKTVVVGYSNHQGLVYSLANVDGIASGNWMNTRSFIPGKFKSPQDDDIKQRSTWYYSPSAKCEYKATLLDVALQRGFLDQFKPQREYENPYSEMLFKGAQPSSTNYNETNSFKHYVYCLNIQCENLTKDTYKETFNRYEALLNSAENEMHEFKKRGISGQNRDFMSGLEANRIAMYANNEDYGFKLGFEWK